MKSVEIFTGAGGLALGIREAGFSHELVVERDRYACDTIRENQLRGNRLVMNWPLVEMDVCEVDYSDLSGPIDLVAGGPPCQPFSMGGRHQAHKDERDMFPQAVRAIRALRPRAFIFENVKGLTRKSFANYFEYIKHQLRHPEVHRRPKEGWENHLARLEKHHTAGKWKGLNYNVVARLLNAAEHGVPQLRERVFIVGFRSDLNEEWSFPSATHHLDVLLHDQWVTGRYWERHEVSKRGRPELPARYASRIKLLEGRPRPKGRPWKTVRDALARLPEPDREGTGRFKNHVLIPGARTYVGHTGSPMDVPAKTLKAGVHGVPGGENMLVRPDGSVRYFTVREAARIQCFPDNYIFHGSWTETMRQLGNAVPVKLGAMVAASVRERLVEDTAERKAG